jgi:ferredoxin
MANSGDRSSLNPNGAWYVDGGCIACGLCVSLAPSSFRMSKDGTTAFVFKQPGGGAEAEEAAAAKVDCPVEAIGDDG